MVPCPIAQALGGSRLSVTTRGVGKASVFRKCCPQRNATQRNAGRAGEALGRTKLIFCSLVSLEPCKLRDFSSAVVLAPVLSVSRLSLC
jgi:hypothetical protein